MQRDLKWVVILVCAVIVGAVVWLLVPRSMADRVPEERAVTGCEVLVNRDGAGTVSFALDRDQARELAVLVADQKRLFSGLVGNYRPTAGGMYWLFFTTENGEGDLMLNSDGILFDGWCRYWLLDGHPIVEALDRAEQNAGAAADQATAVLTEDAAATHCRSQVRNDYGEMTGWEEVPDKALNKGNLVLVCSRTGDTATVYLPGEGYPGVYGDMPEQVLSRDREDIRAGNQAFCVNVVGCDAPDGQEIGSIFGPVDILDRREDWCQVRARLWESDQVLWVPAGSLSYDLVRDLDGWADVNFLGEEKEAKR